jgi:plastocyanin
MKKWLWLLLALGLTSILLVACGRSASAADSTNHGSGSQGGKGSSGGSSATVEVHTNSTNFTQPSVTLKKGDSLKIVNDASVVHIISLGTWENGTAKPEQESGAPNVQNQQLAANGTITIGPWNTTGTYHLYCTVHQNMKLTVNVQ